MTNAHKKGSGASNSSSSSSETMDFNADVARLLDIVAHALYTNHDVFLRELISNAADACDRLRYSAIAKPELITDNPNFRIHIYKDTNTRTLTITDNGCGMSRAGLIDQLGTIAKSGTAALMDKLKSAKDANNDPLKLIGQFGVGFYASYMVADKVSVTSRSAGGKATNTWESDGKSGFDIRKSTKEEIAKLDGERGTAITLHIKDEACEFLLDQKIKDTVEQYSDHIDVKIFLGTPADTDSGQGQPINQASAIWTRPKSEVTHEQYTEFYRSITHGIDEPILTCHWRAEGMIEFNALLFVPTMRPWDLYDPSRKASTKLYVRRVFISDDLEGLMYPWLRFVRGVIDSEDLPLNISREGLQHNPIIAKIRTSVTKRILKDLAKLAKDDAPGFTMFWGQFGAALKEGLYDAITHRDAIFDVCRFFSTHEDGEKFTSLDEYIERAGDNQDDIYYISGENIESLKHSPQIEGFKAKGIEVLFMTDTVDNFWLQQVPEYKGKKFKSVTKGDIDLSNKDDDDENEKPEITKETTALLAKFKEILSDELSDVRASNRLTDSPVCLVAPESGTDMHMERVLKLQQNYQGSDTKPVLEINTSHPLIEKLASDTNNIEDAAHLLMDQARIIQGEPLNNPAEFARRMSLFMEKGI